MGKFLTLCKKTVLNEMIFKCSFLAITLAIASPFIHLVLGEYVKIFLVWGIIISAYCIYQRRRIKNPYLILLLCFAGLYGITIIFNRELNFSANVKALLYMVMIFIVMFGYDIERKNEDAVREIKAVIKTFLIISFFMALVSFTTYVFSIKGHAVYNEQWVYYGMFENRLWGIYNPSTGSAINTISILLGIGYWFYLPVSGRQKVFLAVNTFVQYVCLVLTNSRTALYTLIMGMGLLVLLKMLYTRKEEGRPGRKNILKSLMVSLIVCVVLIVTVTPVKNMLSYLPGAISYLQNKEPGDKETKEEKKIQKEELTRLEELENRPGGFLTGRTELWQAGLETFMENPLFGITRENIPEKVGSNLDDNYWLRDLQRGGVHNIYLTVLISSGLAGFIPFTIFICLLIWSILKLFSRCILEKQNGILLSAAVVVTMQLIMELLEGRILYQVGVFYSLFWCLAGYVFYYLKKDKVKRNSELIEINGK